MSEPKLTPEELDHLPSIQCRCGERIYVGSPRQASDDKALIERMARRLYFEQAGPIEEWGTLAASFRARFIGDATALLEVVREHDAAPA